MSCIDISAFDRILASLPDIDSLSEEREAKLARRATEDARNELVMGNIKEAFIYARHCCRATLPDGEILSGCYVALKAAARNFDPEKGRFFAYAKVSVRSQMKREWVAKNLNPKESENRPAMTFPKNPLHGSQETYESLINNTNMAGHSSLYDQPLEPDWVEADFDQIEFNERWELVLPIIKTKLEERERMILFLRHQTGWGFQEIAEKLNVTREAIRAAHARALKKIRWELMRRKRLYNEDTRA